jgi:hypothetical protein
VRIPPSVSLLVLASALSSQSWAVDASCYSTEVAPRGDTLPANAPALLAGAHISTDSEFAELAANDIELLHNGEALELDVVERDDGFFEAHLLEDLEPGETYQVVSAPDGCDWSCYSFVAGPKAEFPSSTGTLLVVEQSVQGGASHFEFEAYVRLRFIPSDELEPYLSVARITLERVEDTGETRPASVNFADRRWRARQEFALTSPCSHGGLRTVDVRTVVDLPGAAERLRSETLSVTLDCSKDLARLDHATTPVAEFGETKVCSYSGPPGPDLAIPVGGKYDLGHVTGATGCAIAGAAPGRTAVPSAPGRFGVSRSLGLVGLAGLVGLVGLVGRRRRRARNDRR